MSEDSGLPNSFRKKKSDNGKKVLTRTKAIPCAEKDRNFTEVKYTERAPSRESVVSKKIHDVWIDPRSKTIKGAWVDPPRRVSSASSNNTWRDTRRVSVATNASSVGSVTTRGKRRPASRVVNTPVRRRDSYLFAAYSYD